MSGLMLQAYTMRSGLRTAVTLLVALAAGGARFVTMEEAAFTDWALPVFSRGVLRGEALAAAIAASEANRSPESLAMDQQATGAIQDAYRVNFVQQNPLADG
jgi:hypothetical protein